LENQGHTTTAAPSDAKRLAIQDKPVKPFDCTGGFWLAGERDEGTSFAKVDLMENGEHPADD